MAPAPATADAFLRALRAVRSESELATVRKRLAPGDDAIGVRMRDLFDTAKAAMDMPLAEVDALFGSALYEARMGAACILDFRAKMPRAADERRRAYYELYLRHLDRITTWDMVDRAAPSVVGGYLLGRPRTVLYELAEAAEPLRRRIAITAPLYFVRRGDNAGSNTTTTTWSGLGTPDAGPAAGAAGAAGVGGTPPAVAQPTHATSAVSAVSMPVSAVSGRRRPGCAMVRPFRCRVPASPGPVRACAGTAEGTLWRPALPASAGRVKPGVTR